MVIKIDTTDVNIKVRPETHMILKAIRNSKFNTTFNSVVIDVLNESINSNPQNFLKVCRRGGVDIEIPGYSSFWNIPENKGKRPKRIDLRRCIVKYAIVKGEVNEL